MGIDRRKAEALLDRVVSELGAALTVPLVVIGDRLGLFRTLGARGASTADELADAAGLNARSVHEWLSAQAASGFVDYEAASGRFSLSPEQRAVFADEASPVSMLGGFELAAGAVRGYPAVLDAFRAGGGVDWGAQCPEVSSGVARFFRPAYATHLIRSWIPALGDVEAKLDRGARVADVGCGLGFSTHLMARRFPNSEFVGFDSHDPSIEAARRMAAETGVGERCHFETGTASTFPSGPWDLVTFFDCLHDLGDPIGAADHVRQTLSPHGTWMVVEPHAGDALHENANPVGRMFYAASTLVCTQAALADSGKLALGAQAGEATIRRVLAAGGFGDVSRVAESRFHLVLRARVGSTPH